LEIINIFEFQGAKIAVIAKDKVSEL